MTAKELAEILLQNPDKEVHFATGDGGNAGALPVIMGNNCILTIEWKNADIYFPELENEPIVYCTANKKVGTLKSVGNHWEWLKEKYNIKWWCYQWRIVP